MFAVHRAVTIKCMPINARTAFCVHPHCAVLAIHSGRVVFVLAIFAERHEVWAVHPGPVLVHFLKSKQIFDAMR